MSKRRKLEPIQLEDLVNSPFSQGLESVLRFQPPQIKDLATPAGTGTVRAPEPSTDEINSGASDKSAVFKEAPEIGAPEIEPSKTEAPETEATDLIASSTSKSSHAASNSPAPEASYQIPTFKEGPNSGAPLLEAALPSPFDPPTIVQSDLVYREIAKPRPWSSVRDAHTHAEQNLYQTLFNRGKPVAANARGLVIGVRTLARLVPMAYSNCHANLKSLVQKLAIEERPAERYNDGRLFLIYTEEEILRRRRAAGLTHVLKRTRGVSLINPEAPNPEAPATY